MLKLKVPEEDNYRIDPRSVCSLYLMLKMHFNGNYNVIKYNWKYNLSQSAFNSRRDARVFERVAYKFRIHELTHLFVSSLLRKSDDWIGGMTSEMAVVEYRKYRGILDIYDKEFAKEVSILALYCKREKIDFNELFVYDKRRESSRIIRMVSLGVIKYETFILLDSFLNLIEVYDNKSDCFEWNAYSIKLRAYRDLLIIDRERTIDIFHKTLKDKLGLNLNKEKLLVNSKLLEKKYDVIK